MKITIKNLHKSFPKFNWLKRQWDQIHILKGMNFEIKSGSFHGFIGPNGSGKTTTIQALLGIITKDEGKILVDDKNISQSKFNSFIGYIPHEVTFPKHLSGIDFIIEMTKMYGLPKYTKSFNKKIIKDKLNKMNIKKLLEEVESERLSKFLKYSLILNSIKSINKEILSLKEELYNDQKRSTYYKKKIISLEKQIKKIENTSKKSKDILGKKINSWNKSSKELNQKNRLINFILKLEKIAFENNPKYSIKAKAIEMFKYYGIDYAMNKNPNEYSSGMKKKILLIHALINDAQFLILDEPAANLDPDARIDLFDTLYKLNKEGKTIFICSHILKELEGIVDEVTIISSGHVKFNGPVARNIDMTQLYKKSVGKVYADGEIKLPTMKRDSVQDKNKNSSNIERTIKILEQKVNELELENKELKEQLKNISEEKK